MQDAASSQRLLDIVAPADVNEAIRQGLDDVSHGRTWAAIDHPNNRILACGPDAWRSLGWVAPDPATGHLRMLPAETFGPLP